MKATPAGVLVAASIFAQLLEYGAAYAGPAASIPRRGEARSADLGVVINDADSLSIATGEYDLRRRPVPPQNVVHVR